MLTPPKPYESPYAEPSVVVGYHKGIPIRRTESGHYIASCVHEPDGVWQTSSNNGAAAWRWRCRICRCYYGPAISKTAAMQHNPSPPVGPSLQSCRDIEREAQEVAFKMRDKDQDRIQKERGEKYARYLLSPMWRVKRDRVMKRAGGICEGCGVARATEVHHLTYDRIYEEPLFDLVAICTPCHERIHKDKLR